MKKYLIGIAVFALLLASAGCAVFNLDPVGLAGGGEHSDDLPEQGVEGLRIVVDAGHGGEDTGALGRETGVTEAELNLQVAVLAAELFRAGGADVLMTRETADVDYSGEGETQKMKDMNRRAEMVLAHDAQIFVSIHMNSFEDRSVEGAQVFFQKGRAAGEELARHIQEALNEGLPSKDRRVGSGDYFVTKITERPSVIVECGFLTNPDDERRLTDPEYQQELADCIFKGVCDYIAAR